MLTEAGYEPAPPATVVVEIDRGVAARARCAGCGRVGLRYAPYTKAGSYRALAVCPACGEAREF